MCKTITRPLLQLLSIALSVIVIIVKGQPSNPTAIPSQSPVVQPPTVPTINLEAFKGRWFQMYASYIANTTFEPQGYCITADYYGESNQDVAFSFVHSMRSCGPQGMLNQASGAVITTDQPGQFIILYPQAAMGYWVVALGDIPPGEDKYPWAVISAPHQYILYILARDVHHFRHHHQQHVLQWVTDHGYTQDVNKPLETFQGDQCLYPPVISQSTPTIPKTSPQPKSDPRLFQRANVNRRRTE